MIDVLIIIPTMRVGGAERHLEYIVPKLTGLKVVVIRLDKARLCWLPIMMKQSRIVHFFLPKAYIVGGLMGWLTRHPRMIMSRRSLNNYQQNHWWARSLEKFLHKRMWKITTNSFAAAFQLYLEGVKDIHLIPNGIDCDKFQPAHKDSELFRITCVANPIPYKGHFDLKFALSMLKSDLGNKWRLNLIGMNRVVSAAAIPYEWHNSDIGVLPSYQESCPNALLEGMACGVPFVARNVGGIPEIIEHGVNGLLFNDIGEMANAILKLKCDAELRHRLGINARKTIEERFSLDKCVEQYRELYV